MRRGLLLIGASAVVAVAVVAGFLALGTPRDERKRRLDEARVEDLMAIRSAVIEHYDQTGSLPRSLDVLPRRGPKPVGLVDPESGEPYEYKVDDDSTFFLCATFDYASEENTPGRPTFDPWVHGEGYDCYLFRLGRVTRRDLDPVRRDEPATGP